MHLLWRAPTLAEIETFVTCSRAAQPNYAEIGWTRDGRAPDWAKTGYLRVKLGEGKATWEAAREVLDTGAFFGGWVRHLGTAQRMEVGETVALSVRLVGGARFGVYSLIANRVLYRLDEPDCFGYGYGTLPGHLVRGEERFLLERSPVGEVWFSLLTFSQAALPLVQLAQPFVTLAQQRGARHYAGGMGRVLKRS